MSNFVAVIPSSRITKLASGREPAVLGVYCEMCRRENEENSPINSLAARVTEDVRDSLGPWSGWNRDANNDMATECHMNSSKNIAPCRPLIRKSVERAERSTPAARPPIDPITEAE